MFLTLKNSVTNSVKIILKRIIIPVMVYYLLYQATILALSSFTEGSMPLTLCMLIGAIITIVPIFVIYKKGDYYLEEGTREKLSIYKKILYLILIVVVGVIANIIISHTAIIDSSEGFKYTKEVFSTGTKLMQLLAMGIFIPILEEMVFRGIVAGQVNSMYGAIPAIVFSSLLFGFVHSNLPQIIYASVVGLVLGLSYIKTKSLWVPIAGHIIVNCLTLLLG